MSHQLIGSAGVGTGVGGNGVGVGVGGAGGAAAGELEIGTGAGDVKIAPAADFVVDAPVVFTPSGDQSLLAAGTISPSNGIVRIVGNGGADGSRTMKLYLDGT